MGRSYLWLLVVALGACGGSPSPSPGTEQPLATGGENADPAAPADAPMDSDKHDGEPVQRAVEPPPPQGAPPAWLSMPMPAYQNGLALKHAPAICKERVYVNVAGLVGSDGPLVTQIVEKVVRIGSERERNEFETALRATKEAGVDPVSALREIAACEAKGPDIVVVGIATDKPMELTIVLQKVFLALGEPPGQVERQGDLSILSNAEGREAIVQIGPNVLAIGEKDAVLAALRAKAGAAGFAALSKNLASAKTDDSDFTITEKGPSLDVKAVSHLGQGGAKAASELAAKMNRDIQEAANRLGTTQLKQLGDRLRATKVVARGSDVVATTSLLRADLSAILKSAVNADLEQLVRTLKGN